MFQKRKYLYSIILAVFCLIAPLLTDGAVPDCAPADVCICFRRPAAECRPSGVPRHRHHHHHQRRRLRGRRRLGGGPAGHRAVPAAPGQPLPSAAHHSQLRYRQNRYGRGSGQAPVGRRVPTGLIFRSYGGCWRLLARAVHLQHDLPMSGAPTVSVSVGSWVMVGGIPVRSYPHGPCGWDPGCQWDRGSYAHMDRTYR